MKWHTLEQKIRKTCSDNHKGLAYTQKYVEYAKQLYEKDLPLIVSPSHLSMLIGLDHQYVCNMAFGTKFFYRHFTIRKSGGKTRDIFEPLPDLMFVQHWILSNILEKIPVSVYAKAFVKGKNLKHNAKYHRGQTVVVTMDIKDFFPSIHIYDVFSIFKKMGYWDNVAWFLAHLCCHEESLPQGAPTSPYLSNIRLLHLDEAIVNLTKPQKIRFTRYADDLTFSGDFNPHILIPQIGQLVYTEGFQINSQKTRVAYKNTRQEVTGIVVNSHLQISKSQRRTIRQQVYYINKYGLDSHLSYIGETRQNYLNHLLGQINFGLFVNPKDEELKGYFEQIKGLLKDVNQDA